MNHLSEMATIRPSALRSILLILVLLMVILGMRIGIDGTRSSPVCRAMVVDQAIKASMARKSLAKRIDCLRRHDCQVRRTAGGVCQVNQFLNDGLQPAIGMMLGRRAWTLVDDEVVDAIQQHCP